MPDRKPFVAAVDWGTSRLRLWLLDAEGAFVAERRTDEGLSAMAGKDFAAVLENHLDAMGAPTGLPAIICGMAGSRQGWREARYLDAPATLGAIPANAVRVDGVARDVRILPGIAQRLSDRPDVMRGEETQLIGALGARPDDTLVCMPGTHSKWVRITGGQVGEFTTFMTGELFAAVRKHTVLSHAIDAAEDDVSPQPAFVESVEAMGQGDSFMNELFAIRAGQLLDLRRREEGAARLSGLLVGSEIAATRHLWAGVERVSLVASDPLAAPYRKALETRGLRVEPVDADMAVRRGLFRSALELWSPSEIAVVAR